MQKFQLFLMRSICNFGEVWRLKSQNFHRLCCNFCLSALANKSLCVEFDPKTPAITVLVVELDDRM
jgi:hypothetical protein